MNEEVEPWPDNMVALGPPSKFTAGLIWDPRLFVFVIVSPSASLRTGSNFRFICSSLSSAAQSRNCNQHPINLREYLLTGNENEQAPFMQPRKQISVCSAKRTWVPRPLEVSLLRVGGSVTRQSRALELHVWSKSQSGPLSGSQLTSLGLETPVLLTMRLSGQFAPNFSLTVQDSSEEIGCGQGNHVLCLGRQPLKSMRCVGFLQQEMAAAHQEGPARGLGQSDLDYCHGTKYSPLFELWKMKYSLHLHGTERKKQRTHVTRRFGKPQ